jgi:hypothetical protein
LGQPCGALNVPELKSSYVRQQTNEIKMKSPAMSGAPRERCFTSRRAVWTNRVSLNPVMETSQGGEVRDPSTDGVHREAIDHGNDGEA